MRRCHYCGDPLGSRNKTEACAKHADLPALDSQRVPIPIHCECGNRLPKGMEQCYVCWWQAQPISEEDMRQILAYIPPG